MGDYSRRDRFNREDPEAPPALEHETRVIAILVYDGALLLNAIGPAECFAMANRALSARSSGEFYRVELLSLPGGLIKGTANIAVDTVALADREGFAFDTIAVVGGMNVRAIQARDPFIRWLERHAPMARRIASFGSGSFALAQAGLLDDYRCAAHWRIAADLKRRHPLVRIETERLFVIDRNRLTAAGSSSSIDLALKIVEDDVGKNVALDVAQVMIVSRLRTGEQPQLSIELRAQRATSPRIAAAAEWLVTHLDQKPSIADVAQRFAMSERTFARQFVRHIGMTPHQAIKIARLEVARRWLTGSTLPIEKIALRSGYADAAHFKRSFKQMMGIDPIAYRNAGGNLDHRKGETVTGPIS